MEYLVNVLLALALAFGSFWSGKHFSDCYHALHAQRQKEALERQYARLIAHMDADDPCKPYIASQPVKQTRTEAFADKELLAQFENKMKEDGKATALLKTPQNKRRT